MTARRSRVADVCSRGPACVTLRRWPRSSCGACRAIGISSSGGRADAAVWRALSRSATGEAGGRSWRFSRRGFWGRAVEASDLEGARVGKFVPSGFRGGGALRWRDHGLVLRPSSRWRERYALVDGDRELAVVDGTGWGSRSVAIGVGDSAVVEPDPRRRGGDLERRAVLARASARAARDGARWVAWAATALAGGRSWRCCSHEP